MKKLQGGKINTRVSRFVYHYRTTPQTVTGQSPAKLLNNRRYRTALDAIRPNWVEKLMQQEFGRQQVWIKKRPINPGSSVYVKNFSISGPKWVCGIIVCASDSLKWIGNQFVDTWIMWEIWELDHILIIWKTCLVRGRRTRPQMDKRNWLRSVPAEAHCDISAPRVRPQVTADVQLSTDMDVQVSADVLDKSMEESGMTPSATGSTTTRQAASTTRTATSSATGVSARPNPEVRRSRRVTQGRPPARFKNHVCWL